MKTEDLMSVLVVDDSPTNVKLLELTLIKEGYEVLTAMNGRDARRLAKEKNPRLILLDIRMPEEDGFQVIRTLKSDPETAAIPVIFLTGEAEIDSKLKGFELGAVDYIVKPFHTLEVSARVRLHLKLSIATNSLIMRQAEKLKQITEAHTSLLTTPDMEPKANFGVCYKSHQEAGGDFYDVLHISEHIHGYFLADISGHDIRTSYMAAAIKALLKQNCTPVYKPEESIKLINDILIEILPEGKYLTACYARLNRKSRQLSIVSAGHPPIVFLPLGGKPEILSSDGDILGIFRHVVFEEKTVSVSEGDRFFIYSDGLIESAQERSVWTRGVNKMVDACAGTSNLTILEAPEHIKNILLKNVDEWDDDICILGVEV